jgi:hypothetical protein
LFVCLFVCLFVTRYVMVGRLGGGVTV